MQREYGIDLLKIMSMIFIVLDHILFWGGWGFCAGQPGVKGLALESLDAVCLCHVNCFVLASGWISSRLEFKFRRIVKLWLEVWGYSLVFTLLYCVYAVHPSMKVIIQNLLPISMDRYWFFTQYTILFFAIPLLNTVIKNLDRKILVMVLGFGFMCFSIQPFIFKTDIFHLNRGYSALWFMYLYLLAGTMAVHGLFLHVTRCMLGLLVVFGVVGGIVLLHFRGTLLSGIERGFNADLFRAYNCPFIALYSIAMLLLFAKMDKFSHRVKGFIAMVAPSIFSVYVIHSNPLFRGMTKWNSFWSGFLDGHSLFICIVVVVLSAVLIFSLCITIDVIRKRIMSRASVAWTLKNGGR